jgi:hypothetical protein
MTVAAMTAVALDQILTEQRQRSGADLFGPARQLQRQVAKTNARVPLPPQSAPACPGPAPAPPPHQPTHNQQARSGVHLTDRQRPDHAACSVAGSSAKGQAATATVAAATTRTSAAAPPSRVPFTNPSWATTMAVRTTISSRLAWPASAMGSISAQHAPKQDHP